MHTGVTLVVVVVAGAIVGFCCCCCCVYVRACVCAHACVLHE